ncbi:MAG: hypothetical protein ISS57_11350 [Anaerolineales bacterium]|nr:hypothetical protein [Anaerolineales bacterium]
MKLLRITLLLAISGFSLSACDTFQPSQLCGGETEADHQAFTNTFSEMQLVNQAITGEGENGGQTGRVFEQPVSLIIDLTSLEEVEMRLCIFEAKRNGEIVFDEDFSISAGQESFDLGDFGEGSHIIRVYVDGKLVENISFLIQ